VPRSCIPTGSTGWHIPASLACGGVHPLRAPITFGVAILEKAFDKLIAVELLLPDQFVQRERELLEAAKRNIGKLPLFSKSTFYSSKRLEKTQAIQKDYFFRLTALPFGERRSRILLKHHVIILSMNVIDKSEFRCGIDIRKL
jgi:hypothetical protein